MIAIFLNRQEVTAYLESAGLFCNYIESADEQNSLQFLKDIRILLLNLYQKALLFPLFDGEYDKDYDEDLLGEDHFVILKRIGTNLGEYNYYNHVSDPSMMEVTEIVGGLLSDDLGGIYRDLKRALLQMATDSDIAKEDALWSLHFLFRAHYGAHIINALYAIHYFLQYE